jgi:hypothetical protein
MIAHLLVPALDPLKPVTFSKKTVTALLREGMEFGGLIFSDALDMGALAAQYAPEEIAVRSVEAGIDILLHPLDPLVTIKAVEEAVRQGRLTEERIRESVERILDAKRRLGLFDGSSRTNLSGEKTKGGDAESQAGYEKHRRIAREIAQKALKIVSGDRKKLPLDTSREAACFILDDDGIQDTGGRLLAEVKTRFKDCYWGVLTPADLVTGAELSNVVGPARSVILGIFSRIKASKGRSGISPALSDAAREIIKIAKQKDKHSVVVSFDSPYILGQFRDADVLIAAYDRMDEIQQAAAEMLTSGPRGRRR